jgi:uncharacterized protein YndB with AHSA1/START domain
MAHADNRVTIDRPIEEVFAFLADGTNNPRWRSGVLEITRTSAIDGLGSTYRQILRGPGGRRVDGDYEVTNYQPPHQLEFRVTAGPARPTGRFALSEPSTGTTEVTFTLDFTPTGFMRLMNGMITKQMRREVAQLITLKTELENEE